MDYGERYYGQPSPSDAEWIVTSRAEIAGIGSGEWRCPETGWRWKEQWGRSPHDHLFVRRPWTTEADYVDPAVIEERAAVLREADLRVKSTFDRAGDSDAARQAWSDACDDLHVALDSLYSPDFDNLVNAIKSGNPTAIAAAITYLEVDPWCFRSGYEKERILKRLRQVPLDDASAIRVQNALMASLVKGPRREFPLMLRLARHVASASFENRLRALASEVAPSKRRAVDQMLETVAAN